MFTNRWIRLYFGAEKDWKIIYLDYRHFHIVRDILDLYPMKSCRLKLYDGYKELDSQEIIEEYKDYTIKRCPRDAN